MVALFLRYRNHKTIVFYKEMFPKHRCTRYSSRNVSFVQYISVLYHSVRKSTKYSNVCYLKVQNEYIHVNIVNFGKRTDSLF